MKPILRTFAFLLAAATSALVAKAQFPYTLVVEGTITGCTFLQQVNIASTPGSSPSYNYTLEVAPNMCFYDTILHFNSPLTGVVVTTTCGGMTLSAVDSVLFNGVIDTATVVLNFNCGGQPMDCLGVPGGSALPGTACTVPNTALPGFWNANCWCVLDTAMSDCEGVVGGPAMPGTPCTTQWFGQVLPGLWTNQCWCDTNAVGMDCLGIVNGPNVPGSPCWLSNNTIGIWDADCDCVDGTINTGCQAAFWVMQAYEIDSMNPNGGGAPIPYELWIWNLSQGTGNLTYSWSFGDGTGSTDPYPTHTYSGNGPYSLCLTIADAAGCTSVSCDSVSIDDDGILNGMILDHEAIANPERSNGFTLNVRNPLTLGLSEVPALSNISLWPNPANSELNLSLSSLKDGSVNVTLFDVNGRAVSQQNRAFSTGRNVHSIDTSALRAGIYTVRATDREGNSISQRFVKN